MGIRLENDSSNPGTRIFSGAGLAVFVSGKSNSKTKHLQVVFEGILDFLFLRQETKLCGGNSNTVFLFSPRKSGKMNPFGGAYFSKGLVQPPTRK